MSAAKTDSRRLFISFSGGETSAFMSYWLKSRTDILGYDQVIVLFSNTGEENERTLEFVEQCDKAFNLNVVWVEADFSNGRNFKRVNFETASRNGEPFEQIVARYGISNPKFPHCTRELKLRPMTHYLRSIGWSAGSYDTAIGIRVDEIDRCSVRASENRIIYPLVRLQPMTKAKVNFWWAQQSFRLNLKGYQGNCKWCWKKSKRKHMTLALENPEIFSFPSKLESLYGEVGYEFRRGTVATGYKRTFFRGNRSAIDLLQEAATLDESFKVATDDSAVFDPDWDTGGGCGDSESCEIFSDDEDDIIVPQNDNNPLHAWMVGA